jgi:cytochrome oxidase Cu insertion factor (SCO1/SenC/PrrC family)
VSQKKLFMAIVVLALVFLGLVGTLVMMRPGVVSDAEVVEAPTGPLQPDEMLVGYSIPEFELTDQDGRPVDESILDGQVTILDFIFTNCPFACPGMTGEMLKLQESLEGTGVRFLSITVDPQRDTPEVLRAYGEGNGVDFDRWSLLTGPFEAVRSIVRDSLNFHVGVDSSREITLPDGSTMSNVSHPSHLILVGPQRQVLGIYLYYEADRMAELRGRARAAARAVQGS